MLGGDDDDDDDGGVSEAWESLKVSDGADGKKKTKKAETNSSHTW